MLVGCSPAIENPTTLDYTPLNGNDWQVSTTAEQGLDPMLVAELYYKAAELETLYSLLVIKNGYLVAEQYFNEGESGGEQIVPADWVHDSLQTYSQNVSTGAPQSGKIGRYLRDIGYGYQWWSARVGDHHFNHAAGHGGQLIVLLHELDMIVVTSADPFFQQHDGQSWKHEKAIINLVGEFINSLPQE